MVKSGIFKGLIQVYNEARKKKRMECISNGIIELKQLIKDIYEA